MPYHSFGAGWGCSPGCICTCFLEDVIITECHFPGLCEWAVFLAGTGDADLLSKRLNIIQRGDMDEWVMAIDGEGELLWGDMIFYRESGGYIVGGRDITFAPDGTVYYAGTLSLWCDFFQWSTDTGFGELRGATKRL
ncbi:MAG: hypothetical protein R3B93_26550 [Bacteroidia bacterium]